MSKPFPTRHTSIDTREPAKIASDARFMKRLGTVTVFIAVGVPLLLGTIVPTTSLAIGAVATGVAAFALNRKMADDTALHKKQEELHRQQERQSATTEVYESVA